MIEPFARVYLDANVCIYHVERTPVWSVHAGAAMVALAEAGAMIVTSELTIGECLIGPRRDGDEERLRAFERFFGGDEIETVRVDLPVIEAAAAISAATKIRLLDAIHVATAIRAGCASLITNDARIRSLPDVIVLPLARFAPRP